MLDLTAIPTLETERLRLRRPDMRDLDDFAELHADPEVMRFLGPGTTLDRTESWRLVALMIGHWVLRGFGMFTVEEKASGRFIGRAGVWQPEGWPGPELGWTLARSSWGRGLATEAGLAAREYARERLGIMRPFALIHPDNAASIRVATKVGARFERTSTLRGRPVSVYRVA